MAQPIVTRRQALKLGLAAYGSLAAPITLASAPTNNRLIIIILRGAMDGLDLVRPVGDPNYKKLRPTLSLNKGAALNDFFDLHPSASNLLPLWEEQSLGFVHAVATPYRNKRSHFEGQDFLECGLSHAPKSHELQSGWLNRLLSTIPSTGTRTGFAVARENEIILNGKAPITRWYPKTNVYLSTQGERLMESMYQDDLLLHSASSQAFNLLEETRNKQGQVKLPGYLHIADYVGQQLLGETRIASFSINGWDTHKNQRGALTQPLKELSESLVHLRKILGPTWNNTAIAAITEFGRTARENGSFGTDHGTGGLMLLAGGAVRGGKVYGQWPGLNDADLYQQRDLTPTNDVRSYLSSMTRSLFGVGSNHMDFVFPQLDSQANIEKIIL